MNTKQPSFFPFPKPASDLMKAFGAGGGAFQGRDQVCLSVWRSGKKISKQSVWEDPSSRRSWVELATAWIRKLSP